jgi:integrase/recombinase XerD
MSKGALVGPWVKRFLLEHLVSERNLSRNTQRSYRDTLALFLPFASARKKMPIERLEVTDLSREVLRDLLDHLEQSRSCSVRTRNQRLAALHAMARFYCRTQPRTHRLVWPSSVCAV